MDRRDFLKILGASSIVAAAGPLALAGLTEEQLTDAGSNALDELRIGDVVGINLESHDGAWSYDQITGTFTVTSLRVDTEAGRTHLELHEQGGRGGVLTITV